MNQIRIFLIICAIIISPHVFSQGYLVNEGRINISGGNLVIGGNYQNESTAAITLDGTIKVSGNWINNGSGNVISTPGTNGTVTFNGIGTQTIGGSGNVFDFENLTINSGSKTHITAGKGITVFGTSTFNDTLILKSTTGVFKPQIATFINIGTVTGSIRKITVELSYKSTGSSTAGAGRALYFSSPISNATSTILNVPTNPLYYQDEAGRAYVKVAASGTAITVGKGYIVRSATDNLFKFSGTPNTTSYSTPSIPRADNKHFYLLGNPFPSVINWDAIDKSSNISSTIWYRSCDTVGHMVTADTWNSTTQIGTGNNGVQVDGKIPPMQSVWVQCAVDGSGSLTIPTSVRTHSWGTANFFKSSAKQTKDVLRLYLYSSTNRDETVVVQSESAQNKFEDWDSQKLFNNDPTIAEVYTLSPERYNLVIQSVKPIKKDSTIHLGVNVGTEGDYKFVANFSDGLIGSAIYLEDKQLNVTHDLVANPEYLFHSLIIKDTSRFLVHFLPSPTLVINTPQPVCTPSTVDLTTEAITVGSDPGLTYTYWTDNNAQISYSSPAYAESGVYYIKGTALNGTYKIIGPINVIINPTPTVLTTNPTPVIAPATVNLTAPEITLGSTEGLSYTYWLDLNATQAYNSPQEALQGDYYIKGIIKATGCFSISGPVSVVIISNTTGVTTEVTDGASIYSYENQVHLLNFEQNSLVSIFDMLGRQQFFGKVNSQNEIIYCNFRSGIYLIKVTNNKEVKSKKVFIRE